MHLNLNDKTALVSASTSGIGFAIADRLLREGATVIVNGRTDATVAPAVAALGDRHGPARVRALTADLSVAGAEREAAGRYPHVDILVNNMGTYALNDFFSLTDEDWQRMFETNVWSGVRLARTYMKAMLERGAGRVIFVSSEVALTPMAAMAHYSASKATQLSISRSLAELTRGTAVTVNAVLPRPDRDREPEVLHPVRESRPRLRGGRTRVHGREPPLLPDPAPGQALGSGRRHRLSRQRTGCRHQRRRDPGRRRHGPDHRLRGRRLEAFPGSQ